MLGVRVLALLPAEALSFTCAFFTGLGKLSLLVFSGASFLPSPPFRSASNAAAFHSVPAEVNPGNAVALRAAGTAGAILGPTAGALIFVLKKEETSGKPGEEEAASEPFCGVMEGWRKAGGGDDESRTTGL